MSATTTTTRAWAEAMGGPREADLDTTLHAAFTAPRLEVPFMMPDLLPVGGLWVTAADEGLGKTTALVQFCANAATGTPWLGIPILGGPYSSGFLSAEGSRYILLDRMRVALHKLGWPLAEGLPMHFPPDGLPMDLDDPEFLSWLARVKPDISVLDTFTLFDLKLDENSNSDIKRFYAKLKKIAADVGVPLMTWILPHHESKPTEFRSSGKDKIRGAGAILKNSDLTLQIQGTFASPERLFRWPRIKYGPKRDDMAVRLDGEHAVFELSNQPPLDIPAPKEARAKAKEAARDESDRKAAEDVERLIREAGSAGRTAVEIEKLLGMGSRRVAGFLGAAHAGRRIRPGTAERMNSLGRKRPMDVWVSC
jgi:hypothetical protein